MCKSTRHVFLVELRTWRCTPTGQHRKNTTESTLTEISSEIMTQQTWDQPSRPDLTHRTRSGKHANQKQPESRQREHHVGFSTDGEPSDSGTSIPFPAFHTLFVECRESSTARTTTSRHYRFARSFRTDCHVAGFQRRVKLLSQVRLGPLERWRC